MFVNSDFIKYCENYWEVLGSADFLTETGQTEMFDFEAFSG